MKILDGLKEDLRGTYYFVTLKWGKWLQHIIEQGKERNRKESFKVEPKLSLSERLDEVYEIVGTAHRKIDESLFSHAGFTPRALSLYEELKKSCEEVKKVQPPMTIEDYRGLDKFYKDYVALKEELGSTLEDDIPKDIALYSNLSKNAKLLKSSSSRLPKHIRNQVGIELVGMYISSPLESIKVYEVAGEKLPFDKLSESLYEDGLRLKRLTKHDVLGEMTYFLFPFVMHGGGVDTEEGVLKATPLAHPKGSKPPTIYFCRGPRYYAERGMLAYFGLLKSFHDQTVHEYIYTQNFSIFMYNFEGKLIERLRDLFMSNSNPTSLIY